MRARRILAVGAARVWPPAARPMPIEISKRSRADLIASIQDYLGAEFELEVGTIAAEAFLDYALEEIGPAVYNKAVRDAQGRLSGVVADLDLDLSVQELGYSLRKGAPRR